MRVSATAHLSRFQPPSTPAVLLATYSALSLRRASVAGRVRRETGKEYVVRVHCDDGVATHIGPEPCGVTREGGVEASVGERAGQPSSREIHEILVPTLFC